MPVGVAVTLRRARMWEFLDRLISIAVPRIRDFRGLNPRSFDGRGNYSMGVREQLIFPEIDYDSIDEVRGLDVTITTTAQDRRGGLRAARSGSGMPFAQEGRPGAGRRGGRGRGGAAQGGGAPAGRGRAGRARAAQGGEPRGLRQARERRGGRGGRGGRRGRRGDGEADARARSRREEKRSRWQRLHRRSGSAASPSSRPAGTTAAAAAAGPRAYYRKFGLCRICLREAAHKGYVPGMTKSSW